MRLITSNSSSPVSKKLTNLPLPPKNAEVVQKLHPMGQPTEGMIVAAVAPLRSGTRIPMMRVRIPETMAGWRIGAPFILAEIAAHPGDAFAAHDVVRVDHLFDAGNGGDVPTDDNRRIRRKLADHAAHLAHLCHIHDDRGDANDVVLMSL